MTISLQPAQTMLLLDRARVVGPIRWSLLLGLAALFVGVSLLYLWHLTIPVEEKAGIRPGELATVQVLPRKFVQTLDLVGTVEPSGVVNVTAPFDGPVEQRLVDFGTRIERGQIMMVLGTSEVELQLREAEVNVIKARQAVEELRTWDNSSEVARARNAVLSTRLKVDELSRKQVENSVLLERGIIPRIEYDGVISELKAQKLQLELGRQDLNAILRKGSEQNRRVSVLELENTIKRLDELKRRHRAGVINAPVSGLVLRPTTVSAGDSNTSSEAQIGSRLTFGQALFTIADIDALRVRAEVHEIDVNRIQQGQPVTVTGDAFGLVPLKGRVTQISAEASKSSSGAPQRAVFEVVVTIDKVSPEQRDKVRIGMSANISIATYENSKALIVPVDAVQMGSIGPFVLLHDPATGSNNRVPVSVGHSTEDGIEILEGLKPGDSLIVGRFLAGSQLSGEVRKPASNHNYPAILPRSGNVGLN